MTNRIRNAAVVSLFALGVAALADGAGRASAGEGRAAPSASTREPARDAALRDQRLEPGEPVFGLLVGAEPRAYALSDLGGGGTTIHDMVGEVRLDVSGRNGVARVVRTSVPLASGTATNWGSWVRSHPDTSLWRPSAIVEGEVTKSPDSIRVKEAHDYKTALSCAFAQSRMTSTNPDPPGVFVITGTIENVSREAANHVVLRYELIDEGGRVVYREEGFNRGAEALAAPGRVEASEVTPIAAGGSDTFRMIFVTAELPPFASTHVSVARVY